MNQPPYATSDTRVDTFSMHIDCTKHGLPPQITWLQKQLLSNLPLGSRLLRWAVVKIDQKTVVCEGAYLKGHVSAVISGKRASSHG